MAARRNLQYTQDQPRSVWRDALLAAIAGLLAGLALGASPSVSSDATLPPALEVTVAASPTP
jgi:hypothetical protein